jgi:hypothetical protein
MIENSTLFGITNQPHSDEELNYHVPMANNPNNTKAVLWENVQSLMLRKYHKENLWAFCKFVGIGPATGTRIKEQRTSVGMDVIEKIADKFDLQPWHLLVPNLDPANPPLVLVSDVEQKFYASMRASAAAFADVHKRSPDNPLSKEIWVEGFSIERRKTEREK